MVTRQIGDWGLGFALRGAGESATVGHDGSTVGYAARLLVLPATGQGIAVMTNGESEALIDEIERAVAREYAWPVPPRPEKTVAMVDAEGYTALAGRYRVTVGDRNFDFVVDASGEGAERRLSSPVPAGYRARSFLFRPFVSSRRKRATSSRSSVRGTSSPAWSSISRARGSRRTGCGERAPGCRAAQT
jgi:hypothetical protein